MKLTHEGYGKGLYRGYHIEVYKEANGYSLHVRKEGKEEHTVKCDTMRDVRIALKRFVSSYTLVRTKEGEAVD